MNHSTSDISPTYVLFVPEICDVNEGIVERGEDSSYAENEFTWRGVSIQTVNFELEG